MLGLLSGAAFAVVYSVLGLPVARWADRGDRPRIIALAVAVWSVMCALCGAAQQFWQLLLARIGVGFGEAGAAPPSQSLIVEYFPVHRRALAVGIYTAGGSAGYLIGVVIGAQIAAAYGWRAAFVLLGLPGLVLALAVLWTLAEPRRARRPPPAAVSGESFVAALRVLWRKPSYRWNLAGITVFGFFAYGVLIFLPAYQLRVLRIDLATVGTVYGGLAAAATLVGTLGGGWLADRLARRNRAWLLRLPALGVLAAFPCYLLSFTVPDFTTFLVGTTVGGILLTAAVPSAMVGVHAVCGSVRRAMAIAIVLFFMTLVGSSGGPLAVGLASDALARAHGNAALGRALALLSVALVVCAGCFGMAGRRLAGDEEA